MPTSHAPSTQAPGVPNAREAIEADLERGLAARQAHFVPAVLLVAGVVVSTLVIFNVRPDLFTQPPAALALQIAQWLLCLFALPAVGVGLWFPGRAMRVILGVTAVVVAVMVTTGWPLRAASEFGGSAPAFGPCMMLVLLTGAALIIIGFVSGAFVQRRRIGSVFWVAAGLALVSLNVVTWNCPRSGLLHVMPNHLGGAALLMTVAVVVGAILHRRGRASLR